MVGAVPVPRQEVGRLVLPPPAAWRLFQERASPVWPWESQVGKRALWKALGVYRSQAGGPRHGAAGTPPRPQAEPERAKGPNLAAEKHGSTERERKRGSGTQVPTGPSRRGRRF